VTIATKKAVSPGVMLCAAKTQNNKAVVGKAYGTHHVVQFEEDDGKLALFCLKEGYRRGLRPDCGYPTSPNLKSKLAAVMKSPDWASGRYGSSVSLEADSVKEPGHLMEIYALFTHEHGTIRSPLSVSVSLPVFFRSRTSCGRVGSGLLCHRSLVAKPLRITR
jgi:hypothetical protein